MENTENKKIAVVTGASRGIGRACAIELGKAGYTVVVNYSSNSAAADEVVQIIKDAGSDAMAIKANVADQKEVQDMMRTVTKTYGQIDVLVNNAGFGTYGEFAKTNTEREMDMVDLNCTSLTGITGYAIPWIKKGSRIINTASLASFMPLGDFAVYGATKAYVLSFTVALAAELKHLGVHVMAFCPGPVSTEFANVASNGARKEVSHGLSPEKTVAHCLKRSRKGKLYAVMALKWKLGTFGSRFVGRYLVAWFTYKFCKRPSN